jgi:hypothetical protein
MKYQTIRIEGAILAADILDNIEKGEGITGQKETDFKIESGKVKDEIARAWADAQSYWSIFKRKREILELEPKQTGTSETRNQWMIPFLGILGYKLEFSRSEDVMGKSYAISHREPNLDGFPIHIMGFKDNLDVKRKDGGPRMSPHALVQEYLNLTEHLYAIVTNGLQIRLLRDSSRLIKLSFIEFDLERMMDEEHFADFAILYRLLHYTRMPVKQEDSGEALIEIYHTNSLESGSRIRNGLSKAVEKSILQFSNGFLQHSANEDLRNWIEEGDKEQKTKEFYQWQLRLIYRLLFLMVIEERDLIYPKECDKKKKTIYYDYYSINRLRRLSERRYLADTKYSDYWKSIQNTFRIFELEQYGSPLGIKPLAGELFSYRAIGELNKCTLDNKVILDCLKNLSLFQNDDSGQTMRVNYASLNVEEFGSVYEGLLEYDPALLLINGKFVFEFKLGEERSSSGSHYTPDELVQPLIKNSLDYIIKEKLKEIDQEKALLSITVCDVACGSGHILLNAARRIATELTIIRTGEEQPSPSAFRDSLRDVIQNCIYGVDLNPLAIELCKVALWLEAHNPNEPLNFLDHHIKCGNAIVGLAHFEELDRGISSDAFVALSDEEKEKDGFLSDKKGNQKPATWATVFKKTNAAESLNYKNKQINAFEKSNLLNELKQFQQEYQKLVQLPEYTPSEVENKTIQYRKLLDGPKWYRLKQLADIQLAQFFIPKITANKDTITTNGKYRQYLNSGTQIMDRGMSAAIAQNKRFFHWFLEFPQVFNNGGFDCILGNPPYLGGKKISGAYGSNFLNTIHSLYEGVGGQSDLVTYFIRRIHQTINSDGFFGLVTTNSISEGDTREGGLDQIIKDNSEIVFAVKSTPWIGIANLSVSLLTISKTKHNTLKILNGNVVNHISPIFSDEENFTAPQSLLQNMNIMFRGVDFGGKGFILDEAESKLLKKNVRNEEVISPLLNAEDIVNSSKCNPTREIVNFRDFSLEEAKKYPEVFKIIEERVKPERESKNDKAAAAKWWIYKRNKFDLYEKLREFDECIVVPFTSKFLIVERTNPFYVLSNALNIVVNNNWSIFGILQSTIHDEWARKYGSSLETRMRYTPTDVFETFPFPCTDEHFDLVSKILYTERREYIEKFNIGLTTFYNNYHSPDEEMSKMRMNQISLDNEILRLYNWDDIILNHSFYEVDYLSEIDNIRFTISPEARKEILKRLLILNHERFNEEVEAEKQAKQKAKNSSKKATKKKLVVEEQQSVYNQAKLFEEPNLFSAPTMVSEESKVLVQKEDGKQFKYHLTAGAQKDKFTGDYKQMKATSKLGEVMLGRRVDDYFQFGGAKYKILEVE